MTDWTNYMKKGRSCITPAAIIFGNTYGAQTVDSLPSVPASAKTSLSDVADTTFWSPYVITKNLRDSFACHSGFRWQGMSCEQGTHGLLGLAKRNQK